MKRSAPWLLLLLGACAPAAQAPKPVAEEAFVLDSRDDAPSNSSKPDGKGVRQAAISFIPGRVRAPAVHGSVRGKPTWMLVDTGASRNFVADWLVHRIFEDDLGATASDHAGRRIATTFMDQPRLKIDDWGSLPDDSAMIFHDASSSAASDIGVTMSPQTLARSNIVVLDFPHKTMSLVRTHGDAESALPRGGASLAAAQYCRGIYVLPAKIGDVQARLMVDTGAYATDLHPRSESAKALTFHAQDGQGASMGAGGAIAYHRLPHVAISSGAMNANVDVMLLDEVNEDASCPVDGVLGMDVLQSCTLIIDDRTMTGKCGS